MSASASGTSTPRNLSSKPLRILMLHGFTQSGPLFHSKTRALEKNLQKAFPNVSLHYPTAPIRLHKSDVPNWEDPNAQHTFTNGASNYDDDEDVQAFAWWRRKGDKEPVYYEGLDRGLAHVASVLQSEGPFDGAIGFSQGGALAGMLASLLEPGRREAFERHYGKGGMHYPDSFVRSDANAYGIQESIHPQLRFAVSYSGFAPAQNPQYEAFYDPKIATPMLHFLGSLDTVVEEARSLRLVDACLDGRKDGRVVYHPGGHFLPSSQRQYVAALIAFIREIMEGSGKESGERAEDMDLPF